MLDWPEVLYFWFGDLDDEGIPDTFHRERWFRSSRSFDQEIRRRFLSLVLVASEDGLRHWRTTARGRLAEMLLLDQFSRNIYRGSALAFSNDKVCLRLCHEGLKEGADTGLPLVQRGFFYMPLQHSERLADQELAVDLYQQLAASGRDSLAPLLEGFFESARGHRDIIRRFGRFPHRNKVLGRKATEEEVVYLSGGARTFGQ
ncbi:DUF924 family protein [Marinobacter zhejiangensis]|uniref:Uncharacterized conserved protein, DUF924 family n=1 Tax=Marinobacter zhejiangensis TaxID=488535 RepID=A0A1I4P9M1_9GAMM|nr:DUF924 family protein [Marinobacter zhejiangensis]SFM24482.1 Uncharacterized conserved protein, DUF924 family [Marinobacter zhejiangensis]